MSKPIAEDIIRYVLSAHGSYNKSKTKTLPSGKILFYVGDDEIYDSKNHFQTWACQGRTIPKETINSGSEYPADMYFKPDKFKKWLSGLKDCKSGQIVWDLDRMDNDGISLTLSSLIEDILLPYHNQTYPGKDFELHVLTCRVCETNPGVKKKVTMSRERRLPRDRSAYIKPKPQLQESQSEQAEQAEQANSKFHKKYLKYKSKYLALKKILTTINN